MSAIGRFLRPTVPKLILIAEWLASILLAVANGRLTTPHKFLVALWPLLIFYLLACVWVAWSRHTDRIASGRGLFWLFVLLVALDQAGKCVAGSLLAPGETRPIVIGWLHLSNVHNVGGSWLTPVWFKPVLIAVAALVLPLSVIVYRYYICTRRRSLWADLSFLGILAGYTSWLGDMLLRGHVVDFILIPGIVATDVKDVYLWCGGACAVVEALDNPSLRRGWAGWWVELDSARQLLKSVALFAAAEWRTCQNAAQKRFRSPSRDGEKESQTDVR